MQRLFAYATVLAVCCAAIPAQAQFVNRSEPWTNPSYMLLTCVPTLDRTEKNPVVRIRVSMNFHDGPASLPSEMNVVHEFLDMTDVTRSDQYKGSGLWKIPTQLEWAWIGKHVKLPDVSMIGRVWHNVRNEWWYEEALSRGGRVTWRNASICKRELYE